MIRGRNRCGWSRPPRRPAAQRRRSPPRRAAPGRGFRFAGLSSTITSAHPRASLLVAGSGAGTARRGNSAARGAARGDRPRPSRRPPGSGSPGAAASRRERGTVPDDHPLPATGRSVAEALEDPKPSRPGRRRSGRRRGGWLRRSHWTGPPAPPERRPVSPPVRGSCAPAREWWDRRRRRAAAERLKGYLAGAASERRGAPRRDRLGQE